MRQIGEYKMLGDVYMYTIKVTMQAKTDKQHQEVWRVLHVPETSNLGKLMEAVDIRPVFGSRAFLES